MKQLVLPTLIIMIGLVLFVWIYQPALFDEWKRKIPGMQNAPATVSPVNTSIQGAVKTLTGPSKEELARVAAVKESEWAKFYRPSAKCATKGSSLAELECQNDAQNQRANFEARWTQSLKSGWKP